MLTVREMSDKPGYSHAAIYQLGRRGELVIFHDIAQLPGTQDWQRQSDTFPVHARAERVSVRCGLHQAQGTAWFDNCFQAQ